MVILYLVAPIMAPFDISLETFKIFLTSWVKYKISVKLTVYPPFRLIFTVTYRSHFIFLPFTTVRSILHSSIFHVFFRLCDMQWCTAVSQTLFGVFFLVTIWDFYIEYAPYKYVVNIIIFIFLLVPTMNRPVELFPSVATLSVDSRFSVILVFVSFFTISPEIWRSLAILGTLVSCALEEIPLVFFFSPDFSDRKFSLRSCLYCF